MIEFLIGAIIHNKAFNEKSKKPSISRARLLVGPPVPPPKKRGAGK